MAAFTHSKVLTQISVQARVMSGMSIGFLFIVFLRIFSSFCSQSQYAVSFQFDLFFFVPTL